MGIGRRVGGESTPLLRGLVPLFAVAAVLACGPPAAAAGPGTPKLVVVLYPDESDGAPGLVLVNNAIRSTFAAESPGRVELRNEYVNTSRLTDADFVRTQVSLLQRKYAGRKVDLVIAGLSSGLDFALRYRDELFPGVPIVFVAVDQREVTARRLPPDVIGVPIRMDLRGTLDLALRLHPDTRRVFVVAGSAPFDTDWEAEARRAFRPDEERLEFVYLTGLPMDELLGRVADLPERSIIYYLHINRDGSGTSYYPAEALERLAARANAPIYGHVDTYVGRGIVGGRVFDFETEGRSAARLGLRLLAGQRLESIPTAGVSENSDQFDWRQLRRWGIGEQSLPPGSIVRHKEPSLWDVYRWPIIGVFSVCVVEALLIAGLLVQRRRLRRSEAALRETETRFRLMADAAPVLIWTSGVDKACTYLNRPWLEFTGRPPELELGDGWAEGVHPDDRAWCLEVYTTHFDVREPFEMVYRLRRHDGEYRWILDRGVPRLSPGGEFAGYVGACTDITERRRAEDGLRASRRELQLLTGRLLEAQEAERRRVARELHDDLNQGLALLSVEIDLLGQRPPASAAEVAARMRDLTTRVKELSSSVHDLSHQLHPSKLEQLGLVAAVRGLCKELKQHHGLEVNFTHDDVPEEIPEATALCLYRIAQEALRNVVKHGGTDRAEVELSGTPEAIRLRVSDEGAGFVPAARGNGGLGLVSMRERLNLVGGEIAIDSRPGGGTRIDVRVPVPAPEWPEGDLQAEAARG
jgi:PAS domain S-box-containing protein